MDVATGWSTGVSAYRTSQAQLAADFYKAVIGTANPQAGEIEFTGHSLGGGLAGLMASLYGQKAVVFDNMPFQLSALGRKRTEGTDEMSRMARQQDTRRICSICDAKKTGSNIADQDQASLD